MQTRSGSAARPRFTAVLLPLAAAFLTWPVQSRGGDEPAVERPPVRIVTPVDRMVVQRRTRDGGLIPLIVEATVADGEGVEARIVTAADAPWIPLGAGDGPGRFVGQLESPAGGWYRVECRRSAASPKEAVAVVERVGVGEVFVVAGQSNSANHGEERLVPRSDRVVSLAPDGDWRPAADPQPGASGEGGSFLPALGDVLVDRFDVPVGFVACGIGATSVREWLPAGDRFPSPPTLTGRVRPLPDGGWESDGEAFAMLVHRCRQCGAAGIRAVLWHQGESDANQRDPSRTLSGPLYAAALTRLIRATRTETGDAAEWFVARASYHVPGDESSDDIRAAQGAVCRDGLALPGPDSDALGPAFREGGGQGVHFSGAGLRRHAEAWSERIAPWLEERLREP